MQRRVSEAPYTREELAYLEKEAEASYYRQMRISAKAILRIVYEMRRLRPELS